MVRLRASCILTAVVSVYQTVQATYLSTSINVPVGSSNYINRKFASFSIDILGWPNYVGSPASPNTFTLGLMKYLAANNGGIYPEFRIGSGNEELFIWDQSLTQYATDAVQGTDLKRMGPMFVQSLSVLPSSASYVIGVALSSQNYSNLNAMVNNFMSNTAIRDQITAFELGNEPDQYGGVWTGSYYGQTFHNYASWLYGNWSTSNLGARRPILIGGSTANCHQSGFEPSTRIPVDMGDTSQMYGWSCHEYFQNSVGIDVTTALTQLMNHQTMMNRVNPALAQVSAATDHGLEFNFGEANSVFNGGADGVSNVFGSALWGIDFMLYSAANNVTKMFLHQSPWNYYQIWHANAYPSGTTETVYPLYYAYLLVTKALGSTGTTQIVHLGSASDNPNIVSYGVYENSQLTKMVVLDLTTSLQAANAVYRPSNVITLAANGYAQATVSVLTAPGADSKTGVTFAGDDYTTGQQTQSSTSGVYQVTAANDAFSVTLQVSQALLVEFTSLSTTEAGLLTGQSSRASLAMKTMSSSSPTPSPSQTSLPLAKAGRPVLAMHTSSVVTTTLKASGRPILSAAGTYTSTTALPLTGFTTTTSTTSTTSAITLRHRPVLAALLSSSLA